MLKIQNLIIPLLLKRGLMILIILTSTGNLLVEDFHVVPQGHILFQKIC